MAQEAASQRLVQTEHVQLLDPRKSVTEWIFGELGLCPLLALVCMVMRAKY